MKAQKLRPLFSWQFQVLLANLKDIKNQITKTILNAGLHT